MMPDEEKCYAPVFKPMNAFCCAWMNVALLMGYIFWAAGCAFLGGEKARCCRAKILYKIKYCSIGNKDPNIEI